MNSELIMLKIILVSVCLNVCNGVMGGPPKVMENMQKLSYVSHIEKATASDEHEVVIAMQQLNLKYLEQEVLLRSTPGSS